MERFITDERTGIDYELIGKYGRLRQRYLKENRRILYYQLLTSDKLTSHLEQVDNEANEMMERLVRQMAKAQGVTEQLKADDMMKWVGLMNNIKACAEEVVRSELIYE